MEYNANKKFDFGIFFFLIGVKIIKNVVSNENQSGVDGLRERLVNLRMKLNLSQKQFGERLGLQQSYVSRLEKGDIDIAVEILISLYKNFNIDLHELLTGQTYANIAYDDSQISNLNAQIDILQKTIVMLQAKNVSD